VQGDDKRGFRCLGPGEGRAGLWRAISTELLTMSRMLRDLPCWNCAQRRCLPIDKRNLDSTTKATEPTDFPSVRGLVHGRDSTCSLELSFSKAECEELNFSKRLSRRVPGLLQFCRIAIRKEDGCNELSCDQSIAKFAESATSSRISLHCASAAFAPDDRGEEDPLSF